MQLTSARNLFIKAQNLLLQYRLGSNGLHSHQSERPVLHIVLAAVPPSNYPVDLHHHMSAAPWEPLHTWRRHRRAAPVAPRTRGSPVRDGTDMQFSPLTHFVNFAPTSQLSSRCNGSRRPCQRRGCAELHSGADAAVGSVGRVGHDLPGRGVDLPAPVESVHSQAKVMVGRLPHYVLHGASAAAATYRLTCQVWNWVVVAIALAMYALGAGYHSDTVGPENVANISRLLLVAEIIYIWHMCWTKLSVLVMYYRIFRIPHFKKLVIAVGTFVIIWAVTATFLFTFICVPPQKLWYPDMPGHCVSEMGVWVANASSTIFSDIAILTLPIPQVWKLHTKRAEKIGLTMVFGLGFL